MKLRNKIIISAFVTLLVAFGLLIFTQKELPAELMVDDRQYTQVALADVPSYASTTANNYVVTSGTVVGIRALPPYQQLVLGDGKGNYVAAIFGRLDADLYVPILSNLKIGDTVEVMGQAGVIKGMLVSAPDGVMIETGGGNLKNALYFGEISLGGVTKIK